jgi:hypothetical protein
VSGPCHLVASQLLACLPVCCFVLLVPASARSALGPRACRSYLTTHSHPLRFRPRRIPTPKDQPLFVTRTSSLPTLQTLHLQLPSRPTFFFHATSQFPFPAIFRYHRLLLDTSHTQLHRSALAWPFLNAESTVISLHNPIPNPDSAPPTLVHLLYTTVDIPPQH